MLKRETIDRHLADLADKVRFLRSCQKYTLKGFKENTQVRFSSECAMQLFASQMPKNLLDSFYFMHRQTKPTF